MENVSLTHIFITLFVLIVALTIHEAAHAWSARALGDPTAHSQGRVSLNPIVHIDLVGTVLFPLFGLLFGYLGFGGVVFGWAKPVPVNVQNLKNPRQDHLLIAAAGPVSNILQALVCLVGLYLFSWFLSLDEISSQFILVHLFTIFYWGLILNVILAVFNLFPIPPLDGSWILQGILPEKLTVVVEFFRPYGFLLLLMLLLTGIFGSVIETILVLVREMVPQGF